MSSKGKRRVATRLWGALAAVALVALAAPASAKVVEFTATLRAGLGDEGNLPTTPNSQPNGLPICNKGLVAHTNASVPAHGFVAVSSGPAPQSIMDFRPYKYGTAGATGTAPTLSMPGVAGLNGAAQFASSTCDLAIPASKLPPKLVARTQASRFTWPANHTVFANASAATGTSGAGTGTRLSLGTGLQAHTLAAGAGPGAFSVSIDVANTQLLSGVAGPNQFGGGFRASGGGRVDLQVNLVAPGNIASGYWITGPRLLGHNQAAITPTAIVTRSGTFATVPLSGMIFAEVVAWNMPFTTGTVRAEDHGGQFTTIRTAMGFDNRTSLGEVGTLLLVTPWAANIADLGLYFGGTASLEFHFMPEPGETALLAVGVMGILALHLARRRRQ